MADNEVKCSCGKNAKQHLKDIEEESFASQMVKSLINTNKRLVGIIIILSILFTGYIIYDNYIDSLYDIVEISNDAGNANYIGGSGDINNGKN